MTLGLSLNGVLFFLGINLALTRRILPGFFSPFGFRTIIFTLIDHIEIIDNSLWL